MKFSAFIAPVIVAAAATYGAFARNASTIEPLPERQSFVYFDSTDTSKAIDTLIPSMFGPSLAHGNDLKTSPCLDFYQYANGGWRNEVKVPPPKGKDKKATEKYNYNAFSETDRMMQLRLKHLLDSSRSVYTTTDDQTLKVIGTFYESCMVADSLEQSPFKRKKDTTVKEPTRAELCLSRVTQNLGGAVGQAFVKQLVSSGAVERMDTLLNALRAEVVTRLKAAPLMTESDKEAALSRLAKLHLRVGIPDKLDDYSALVLSPTDYHANKTSIANFNNIQWVQSIGGNNREKWKASLLTTNAFYMPGDHAIEIPTIMFSPPFFYPEGEDALNFGGVGYIIGHEIYHSIAPQLPKIEHPQMAAEIDSFKAFGSGLGTVDGWATDGKRTFQEDVADLGGAKVAYSAWKATIKANKKYKDKVIDGHTPDQRFFLAVGRVWRAKWTPSAAVHGVHAAYFARVNSVAMQNESFSKAFGCKEGDKMFMTPEKRAKIW